MHCYVMADLLSDSVAVVTGASSGNGRAIALTLANHGADIVVADIRREPRLEGTLTDKKITEETESAATYVECDVTRRADLESAVEAAEEFGGIDIMVNNAGIIKFGDFFDETEGQYHKVMDVNTKGVYFGSKVAAEHMLDAETAGSIVNIASIDGIAGTEIVSYCGSKGSVISMTYSMAKTLAGTGIRVNAIAPGLVETAMTTGDSEEHRGTDPDNRVDGVPLQRVGEPQDIANVALFLSSDLSSYVNAETVVVDGGVTNTQSVLVD